MVAPSVASRDPAPDDTEVARSENIFFAVISIPTGVKQDTIDVKLQIDGGGFFQAVTAGAPTFPADGPQATVSVIAFGFAVRIDNRGVWPSASQVDVRVNAQSLAFEAMGQVDYAFTCATGPVNPGVLLQIAKG